MLQELKNIYHFSEAVLANIAYGFPSKSIKVIGVTGTDGKTTTSHLIYHILKSAGKKVAMTSSIYSDVAGDIADTGLHVTTQSRWEIQKNLKKAAQQGYEFFVLETTSHGLDQHRVWGVQFDIGVITNITREHLDYHKTYENYLVAKTKLLLMSKMGIVNADDGSFEKVEKILKKHSKSYITYSLKGNGDVTWIKSIQSKLKEKFNRENILAAYGACRELGIDLNNILKGIRSFELPKGRFDKVYDEDFKIVIDFAHTPNSIRKLMEELRGSQGRLIHVFGSAGLRDQEKRPDMGRASAENADMIVLTEEDYRTEDFRAITRSVSKGIEEGGFEFRPHDELRGKKQYTIIENRQDAINHAIKIAKDKDTVIITGKGHEQSLARGKKEFAWDEYRAVRKGLILKHKT